MYQCKTFVLNVRQKIIDMGFYHIHVAFLVLNVFSFTLPCRDEAFIVWD